MVRARHQQKKSRKVMIILISVLILVTLAAIVVGVINLYMIRSTESQIVSVEKADENDPDCIIVLGAMVFKDGSPSAILRERLDKGIELYKAGVSDKLLMSGDNGQKQYNEVVPMMEYAIEKGVPQDDIYLDYAGFSTYESMYRLRDIFEVDSAVVVTQQYHLYRALFIGDNLDINISGVAAADKKNGQLSRDIREIFARVKSFFLVVFDADPTYLGDTVSLDEPQDDKVVLKE